MDRTLGLASKVCILLATQVLAGLAFAQNDIVHSTSVATNSAVQPRAKGEAVCYELKIQPVKTICDYLPKYESATNLQTRILKTFFGGRQPGNPEEAYVSVLNNGQLEFAHTDPAYIKLIKDKLSDFDVLDTYIEKRKVNLGVRVYQMKQNADNNLGYMMTAQYSDGKGSPIGATNRAGIVQGAANILNVHFAMGNLVNTLLEAVLTDIKARQDIEIMHTIPLYNITHGTNLNSQTPYSRSRYLAPTSVQAITETVGVRFEGQARFHENKQSKILIKDFVINISQPLPSSGEKKGDAVDGVENFKAGPMDLELEVGCSTAIRVLNVVENTKIKERNFIFSYKDQKTKTEKDFLFIIQAVSDSSGTAPSQACSETVIRSASDEAK